MTQNSENMEPIVYIGPMKTGKSTVGRLLAERLGCRFKSLDWWERRYIEAVGFDEATARAIKDREGDLAWYNYRRGFFDAAVVLFLQEHKTCVLE